MAQTRRARGRAGHERPWRLHGRAVRLRAPQKSSERKHQLSRIRTMVDVLAIALPIPAAVAGCGGGSSSNSADPQQVLSQTFNNPTKVTSGNVDISLSGSAQGSQSGSFNASITGPFQSDPNNPTAFPQLNLTAKISGSSAGQSISFDGSLIATQDNAYVVYQNQAYEVGTSVFKQFTKAY